MGVYAFVRVAPQSPLYAFAREPFRALQMSGAGFGRRNDVDFHLSVRVE